MVSCRWSRQGMSVVVERKAWWRRRRMALRVCGSGATTRPREFSLERALVAERASSQQQSPSWVNRVGLTICRRLPVLLRQRTSSGPVGMSQRCQLRTMRRRRVPLFDHLVDIGELLGQPRFAITLDHQLRIFDSRLRAIHADIVKAGSISTARAAASRASASRPRWAKADARQRYGPESQGFSDAGLSSLQRWPRQSDEAQ